MEKDVDYVGLVKRAQLGDEECLRQLTKLAEGRLRTDVYRLTLKTDLTQDIVQESILEMLKILSELKEAERFWPWMYKIALNKVRFHQRTERHRKTVSTSSMGGGKVPSDGEEPMADMVSAELKQIVVKAMQGLKPEHRAVLTLRCYREMDYSVIAESMGCSEFAAKMLFQRAKKALKKELSLYGFGKGSMMMALILFGKMTAPSEAAEVSVAAATTKVGVTAGLVGILGSKTTIVSLAAAGAVAVGAVVATSGPDETMALSREKAVGNSSVGPGASQPPQAADECWYYFPESADGPVMMWAMNSGSEGKGAHCLWRQNERGNYRFDRRKNTVYIQNHRMWQGDLGVWRLPTDQQKLREFLSGVDGQGEQTEYVRDRGRGLVVISRRDKDKDGNVLQTIRHQHLLEEERFLYDWPAAARTVDNRDAMHKRGWTYFRVDGQISGEKVRGVGRIPFVYEASRDHTPWLALKVGSRLKVVDNGAEALVYDRAGKVTASYAGGSFFAGLARPWMGLHTIDTVRRDAAGQEIPFETRYEPGEEKAEIVLTCRQGRLVYEIDMERDVVDSINVSTSEGKGGELKFRYLQDVEEAGDEFIEPRVRRSYGSKRRASPGVLWLLQLVTRGS